MAFAHQLQQLALAGDDVAQVQAGEFVLVRQRLGQLAQFGQARQDPVVEWALVFEFQRADAVRDAFEGVFDRVRPAVHRVDAPLVARAVVGGMAHAVHDRIAQVDVGRSHVDLRAQHQAAVGMLAVAHFAQQRERFRGGAVAPGRIDAGFGQRAAVGTDFLGALLVHVSVAGLDQRLGEFVHVAEVVAGEVQVVVAVGLPVEAQPVHGLDDGVDVLLVFLFGVGVVEAQVADAAEIARQPEVQADALGVADVQVAVGLRRKAGADTGRVQAALLLLRRRAGLARPALASEAIGSEVVLDDIQQEIGCGGGRRRGGGHS
ncbi:hypothetical protein D9M68_665200 [compost metagenome]